MSIQAETEPESWPAIDECGFRAGNLGRDDLSPRPSSAVRASRSGWNCYTGCVEFMTQFDG
jgi:hypothetical protein